MSTKPKKPTSRTQWAEQSVAAFLSMPLISEFVFRSPQTLDGTQKEVADLLVWCGGPGLLISQKCQEDPGSRSPEKAEAWVRKTAKEGLRQLRGAIRAGSGKRPIWCDHPRRGRVEFPEGLPPIAHGIVLVETLQSVKLDGSTGELPLQIGDARISYLSLNDFLNVTDQLRTLPEIMEYLDRRRGLPFSDLRTVGTERDLFAYYLLNQGSFEGCLGIDDARVVVASRQDRIGESLRQKSESDRYSRLIEHVAHELASRRPNYTDGLTPEQRAMFDGPDKRQHYLEMQRVLANLGLRERAELGRLFESTTQKINAQGDFVYCAAHLDSQPDWVYVLASSKGVDRSQVYSRVLFLGRGAMTQYEKRHCLVIVDREGDGYEVGLLRAFKASPSDNVLAEKFFARLRMEDRPLPLVPDHD